MVEVRNLSKAFGETVAVDDVSFEVNKGEILGFLGPNGAGKTTTMRILTCYIPPDAGSAKVAGYDTEPVPWHGLDQSIEAALPPLAVVWLRWAG